MTDYLTEQEQIEILKNWFKQYSFVILSGIFIAVLISSGWHLWQQRQNKIFSHASSVYDEMIAARGQNGTEETAKQAEKLFKHYSQLVYSEMAALMLARDAILKHHYQEAVTHLNWVINHSTVPALRQIARLRLARLFIAEKKPAESLKVLVKNEDKNFDGLSNEVRGDAYLAMQNIKMARESYRFALTELPNAEAVRPLLQMKFDNLIETNLENEQQNAMKLRRIIKNSS